MFGCSDCCSLSSSCCDSLGCPEKTVLGITAIALAAGVFGMLVVLGLQIGWAGIGCISHTIGLYTMISGYTTTLIAFILIAIACCKKNQESPSTTNPWGSDSTSFVSAYS